MKIHKKSSVLIEKFPIYYIKSGVVNKGFSHVFMIVHNSIHFIRLAGRSGIAPESGVWYALKRVRSVLCTKSGR